MTSAKRFELSSAALHVIAMALMLCDHLWATIIPGNQWLNAVGRVAFPIFAFLIAQGYFHTKDLKRYMLRLLLFALIAEIPFNLICVGSPFYPFHQNVLWTLLLGLCLIHLNELARMRGGLARRVLASAGTILIGYAVGFLAMLDYYGVGILTVLVFYFFRERKWWHFLAQFAALYYLNVEILGGLYYEVTLFGQSIEIVQQGLSLFALLPIWLYRGRQGHHSRAFRALCYGFYPAHMLVLYLIGMLL